MKPGSFLQLSGWVLVIVSILPLSIGAITAVQGVFLPLAIGFLFLLAGATAVIAGRFKLATSPNPTRPSRGPGLPPPPQAPPAKKSA
jgi:hypothetical protein